MFVGSGRLRGCGAPLDLLDCEAIAEAFERDLEYRAGGGRASRGGRRCTREDATGVGVSSDSRSFVDTKASEVVPAHECLGLVEPDPDLRDKVGEVALLGESLLDRDGAVDGIDRLREDREEPIAATTLS